MISIVVWFFCMCFHLLWKLSSTNNPIVFFFLKNGNNQSIECKYTNEQINTWKKRMRQLKNWFRMRSVWVEKSRKFKLLPIIMKSLLSNSDPRLFLFFLLFDVRKTNKNLSVVYNHTKNVPFAHFTFHLLSFWKNGACIMPLTMKPVCVRIQTIYIWYLV